MARSATLSGTVNWSDATPFNGFAVFLLVPPDGYSKMFLADNYPAVRIPLRIIVPVVNGQFNQNCKIWYNADLEPPNSKWVIYWLDFTGATIASPASMSDSFTVSTSTHTVTPPTLTAPTAEASLPPVDWDPTPTALANYFTGDVNAGDYQITNVKRIVVNEALISKGLNSVSQNSGLGYLDYSPSDDTTRIVSRGGDASTNGGFIVVSTRSDGTNQLTYLYFDSDGNAYIYIPSGSNLQIVGLETYANNAAAASGGVPVNGLYIASSGDPRPLCVRT